MSMSIGMEIGEFASYMVPVLLLEGCKLLARLTTIVMQFEEQLIFY